MTERGKYIIIEGMDGTGKSTVANKIAEHLRENGRKVMRVDEPAGAVSEEGTPLVPIADALRSIIKNETPPEMPRSPMGNVLMFTAARYENWTQALDPFLATGGDVVGARNWRSTDDYQGYGEGLDHSFIKRITHEIMGDVYMHPDLEVILDISDDEERRRRIAERGELAHPDTFEKRDNDFQTRLKMGYRAIAHAHNLPIIEAGRPLNDVVGDVWLNHVLPLYK